MTKRDLILSLSRGTTLSKKNAEAFLNEFVVITASALKNGQTVQLIPFGTFKARFRKARRGKNPRTHEPLLIQSANTVVFRPGKFFRNGLK